MGYDRAVQVVVRVVLCCVAVSVVAMCVAFLDGPAGDIGAYRRAKPCAAGQHATARADCLGRETGRVADKNSEVVCNSSSSGTTCDTVYSLVLDRPGHGRSTVDVGDDAYRAARRGSAARMRIWRNEIVGVTVRGKRTSLYTSSEWTLFWLLLGASVAGLLIPWIAAAGWRHSGTGGAVAVLGLGVALLLQCRIVGAPLLGCLGLVPALGALLYLAVRVGRRKRWIPAAAVRRRSRWSG